MPEHWKTVAPGLYASKDQRISREAEDIAASFGDDSMFPRLRDELSKQNAAMEARRHAFAVLSRAQDAESLPVFFRLLDDGFFRIASINLLARFDDSRIPKELLQRLEQFDTPARNAALNTLSTRPSFAIPLLKAIADGKVKRDILGAYHVRQFSELKNPEVDKEIAASWGRIGSTASEKREEIARLEKIFNEAPLWAYDARAGREHFQKICAQCHKLGNDGVRLGPELTGAGRNGISYFLENIIDPNAVIGTDFQMTSIETADGEVVSGILAKETGEVLTIRTPTGEVSVERKKIKERTTSDKSLMPEGLLTALSGREQIELLKYLTEN